MTQPDMAAKLSEAIQETLTSANETDSNGEVANVVDGLFAIARSLEYSAKLLGLNDAMTPMGAIESLGKTIDDGSTKIADAINNLAEAIRERNE